jgi:sorbitol-specific phosphotransferase system component IIC
MKISTYFIKIFNKYLENCMITKLSLLIPLLIILLIAINQQNNLTILHIKSHILKIRSKVD